MSNIMRRAAEMAMSGLGNDQKVEAVFGKSIYTFVDIAALRADTDLLYSRGDFPIEPGDVVFVLEGGYVGLALTSDDLSSDEQTAGGVKFRLTQGVRVTIDAAVANGSPLPDPSTNSGDVLAVSFGDKSFILVSNGEKYTATEPAPDWMPSDAKAAIHFGWNRAYLKDVGWMPIEDLLTVDRSSADAYAPNSSGVWESFAADTLRLTDLGLFVEGTRVNRIEHSMDLTINYNVQTGSITGTYVDGETVTWTGGSGILVMDQSEIDGSGAEFLALRSVSGVAPTGTLTGGTSGATANQSSNDEIWVHTNMTVVRDQTGADGVANSATKLTATAANATCTQNRVDGSATNRIASVTIKRITGSGSVYLSIDGGTTQKELTFDSDGFAWLGTDAQSIASTDITITIATSGDEVAVWSTQVENGSDFTSPYKSVRGTATRQADRITSSVVSDFSYLRSDEFSVVMAAQTYDPEGGTFLEIDNDGSPEHAYRLNFVDKGSDDFQIGVTNYYNGSQIAGFDPQTEKFGFDVFKMLGYTVKRTTGRQIVALTGDTIIATLGGDPLELTEMPDHSLFSKVNWGAQSNGTATLQGFIRWAVLYDKLLTETELSDLTTPGTTTIEGGAL